MESIPIISFYKKAGSVVEALDIMVLDTQPVARAGTISLLSGITGVRIPREAESPAAAWSMLAEARPDLLILELNLNGPSGLDFVRQVRQHYGDLKLLVFSVYPEEWYADRALRAGAMGYVMKSAEPAILVAAVRQIAGGELFVSSLVSELIVSRLHASGRNHADPAVSLSDRELEVFLLIGQGFSTSEIARRLRVSVSSIESYRAGIKRKLGLKNCSQLVHAAVTRVVSRGQ